MLERYVQGTPGGGWEYYENDVLIETNPRYKELKNWIDEREGGYHDDEAA